MQCKTGDIIETQNKDTLAVVLNDLVSQLADDTTTKPAGARADVQHALTQSEKSLGQC